MLVSTQENLARLEAVAGRLRVPETLIGENLDQIRHDRKIDGDNSREFSWLRAAIRLSSVILTVAEAHGACRRRDCNVCPALKVAVAQALAVARDDKDRDGQ